MLRMVAASLFAVGLCVVQSGCCCRCGVPLFRPPPVVIQQPVVQQPPAVIQPPAGPKEYTYVQSTGQLKLGNEVIGTGYSGQGAAKNNPAMQFVKDTGPIPTGDYLIHRRTQDDKTGEPIIELHTAVWTNTGGRKEMFKIVADSNPPGNAGVNAIVLPRDAREKIDTAPLTKIKVVP